MLWALSGVSFFFFLGGGGSHFLFLIGPQINIVRHDISSPPWYSSLWSQVHSSPLNYLPTLNSACSSCNSRPETILYCASTLLSVWRHQDATEGNIGCEAQIPRSVLEEYLPRRCFKPALMFHFLIVDLSSLAVVKNSIKSLLDPNPICHLTAAQPLDYPVHFPISLCSPSSGLHILPLQQLTTHLLWNSLSAPYLISLILSTMPLSSY